MRENTIMITERDFIFTVAGQLYEQAPNRAPRKADIIISKVRDNFRKSAFNYNEFYIIRVAPGKIEEFVRNIFNSIPEFEELNLSQIEYDKGVKVDDPDRGKYKFVTRYDKEDAGSWKKDFIDLDAYFQNVAHRLKQVREFDADCFCCIHKNTDKCNNCKVNPKYTKNYESSRKPKGEYTLSCMYDCKEGKYICCKECKKADTCEHKCKADPENCEREVSKNYK